MAFVKDVQKFNPVTLRKYGIGLELMMKLKNEA